MCPYGERVPFLLGKIKKVWRVEFADGEPFAELVPASKSIAPAEIREHAAKLFSRTATRVYKAEPQLEDSSFAWADDMGAWA